MGIQLIFHQAVGNLDNRHILFPSAEFPCGFQPKNAAADNRDICYRIQLLADSVGIRQLADYIHILTVRSVNRRNITFRPCSQNQLVIRPFLAV